jgi:hypothetical protein
LGNQCFWKHQSKYAPITKSTAAGMTLISVAFTIPVTSPAPPNATNPNATNPNATIHQANLHRLRHPTAVATQVTQRTAIDNRLLGVDLSTTQPSDDVYWARLIPQIAGTVDMAAVRARRATMIFIV